MKHLFIPIPVLLAALAALLGLATSCTSHFTTDNIDFCSGTCSFDYPYPEQYTSGDAAIASPVRSISLDWFGGDIEFAISDSDTLYATETITGSVGQAYPMQWRLEPDGELHLAYVKAGKYKSSEFNRLSKRLLIRIPRGTCLDELELDAVNGSVRVDNLLCRSLSFDCVNLNLQGSMAHAPAEVSVEAVNSKINLTLPQTTVLHIDKDCINTDVSTELPLVSDDDQANCEISLDGVNSRVIINAQK